VTAAAKTLLRLTLAVCVLGLGAAGTTASTAFAASPCWKQLINDWYDGRIDKTYEVHCYRDAIKHLPADVKTYSDAYDVISRALTDATRGKKNVDPNMAVPPPGGGDTGNGDGGTGTGTGGSGGSGGSLGGGSGPTEPPGDHRFLNDATGKLGSDRADSVPIPLLVLAGLAVLLVAAGGAGLVARRIQARRGHA
jgi:hypothetical protein